MVQQRDAESAPQADCTAVCAPALHTDTGTQQRTAFRPSCNSPSGRHWPGARGARSVNRPQRPRTKQV